VRSGERGDEHDHRDRYPGYRRRGYSRREASRPAGSGNRPGDDERILDDLGRGLLAEVGRWQRGPAVGEQRCRVPVERFGKAIRIAGHHGRGELRIVHRHNILPTYRRLPGDIHE
jgi:hypothetical protein